VCGELSACTQAASGHRYFSLKDAQGHDALIRCALFKRSAAHLSFVPRDGLQVEAVGRLALYEPRGDLQFIVESLHLVGSGSLYEEFLRLKSRLQAEGLFDEARKRPLPGHPRRIAVVSSLQAAALRDVLTVIQRRAPHVQVVVYPSLVQGTEAPVALVRALQQAADDPDTDVVILARGGGSLEDLWFFNDERVVRAVVGCPKPLVCGVGHETDVTLSDFAADIRAATPTAAAAAHAAARHQAERRRREGMVDTPRGYERWRSAGTGHRPENLAGSADGASARSPAAGDGGPPRWPGGGRGLLAPQAGI